MQNFLFKEKSSKFCMLDILQTAAAACLFEIESGRIYSWVLQCEMKDNLSCIPQNNTEVSGHYRKKHSTKYLLLSLCQTGTQEGN